MNFFHAEGQGLPLESLRDGSYKVRPWAWGRNSQESQEGHRGWSRVTIPADAGRGTAPAPVLYTRVHRAILPGQAQAGGRLVRVGATGSPTASCLHTHPTVSQAPQNRFGRLNVRCHYEAAEQRLVVAVLHAADLPPLDANGERA